MFALCQASLQQIKSCSVAAPEEEPGWKPEVQHLQQNGRWESR